MPNIRFQNNRAFYLAGNPIVIGVIGTRYRIRIGAQYNYGQIIYEGVCVVDNVSGSYFNVDISNLFSYLKDTAGVTSAKITVVSSTDVESGVAENTPGGSTVFYVFGGGISKLMMRRLKNINSDIFTEKLKNNLANFILSTRNGGNYLFIPENELLPLKYYGKGMKYDIKSGSETILSVDHTSELQEKIFSIDLALLRKQTAINSGKLVSDFRFMNNGNFIFQVFLLEVKTHTKYCIDFINSWGVRERLAVHGIVDYTPEFMASEKNKKNFFDKKLLSES